MRSDDRWLAKTTTECTEEWVTKILVESVFALVLERERDGVFEDGPRSTKSDS